MWFMEAPGKFSVGQTAESLTCSILEKPHTGLDDCLRMLQACFRKRMSGCGYSVKIQSVKNGCATLTVLRVEGALVVVRVDSGELDLVAGLAHVAEEDGVGGGVVDDGVRSPEQVAAVERGIDDAGGEGGAVEAALVLGHGNESVDERLLLDDVEGLLVVVGALQLVGLFAEQGLCRVGEFILSCYCSAILCSIFQTQYFKQADLEIWGIRQGPNSID